MVRLTRFEVRRISLRAMAPAVSGFQGLAFLRGWDDGCCAASGDGVMAFSGVEGAVSGDAADLLLGRNLAQQFGQHGRIADLAGGDLCGLNFRGFSSIPMWILRQTRRFVPPCLRAFRSPSILMPVLSIRRCSGPSDPR